MKQLTKYTGSIAEQAVTLELLKRKLHVSVPIGDYLPYDLIIDNGHQLLKIQIKCAWWDKGKHNYVVDNRRTRTNRRHIKRSVYTPIDFDFAICYLLDLEVYYIMPSTIFCSYASEIHFVESDKRQRKPKSATYREAWFLLL